MQAYKQAVESGSGTFLRQLGPPRSPRGATWPPAWRLGPLLVAISLPNSASRVQIFAKQLLPFSRLPGIPADIHLFSPKKALFRPRFFALTSLS